MVDNVDITPGAGRKVATDQVSYSGDTADVQLVKIVAVSGAEGSKSVTDIAINPNGRAAAVSATPVVLSNEDLAAIGPTTESPAASDTATSGLNGMLKRIAQRITSLMALFPATLDTGSFRVAVQNVNVNGQTTLSASTPVAPASDWAATPYALPANFVSGAITTAMTATTSTSLVAAPGASLRNYITTIIVSNAHATVGTDVVIQDGSGGTVLLTIPAAALYGGAVITLPVPLRQPTANTALFCANVTTGASTKVSAVGFKAA